ncbi:MAG: FxsA family protein [Solirubrobacteraceae bacterium]
MIFALVPIVWLLAELLVAIQVAHAVGVGYMLLLLVVSWPLGGWALRSQGRAAWRRLSAAVTAGRSPGHEVLDGALVLIGGLLLIVPGFLSDLVGVCALLPPTRSLLRGRLARHLQGRFMTTAARFGGPTRSYDVDSTATDVDQSQLSA